MSENEVKEPEQVKEPLPFLSYAKSIVDGNPDKAAAQALIAIAEELRRLNANFENWLQHYPHS